MLCLAALSQPAPSDSAYKPGHFFNRTITLRFNPFGLADPYDENISFGAEHVFRPQWSAGSDVAYVFNSVYLEESKIVHGFIVRPFIRYYFRQGRRSFLEAEGHFKYAAYQITDWLGRDVVNGVPSYEEFASFNFIKKVYGINIKTGGNLKLSRDGRFRLEGYVGVGVRLKNQGVKNGLYNRQVDVIPNIYNPVTTTVSIPLGVRFLYDIKRAH